MGQQTPLETFWPAVVFAIAIPEIFSVFTFNDQASEPWTIRSDHVAGDLGFDPLGLKPEDPAELKEMQTKELNNGRLAMMAIAGMVAQEASRAASSSKASAGQLGVLREASSLFFARSCTVAWQHAGRHETGMVARKSLPLRIAASTPPVFRSTGVLLRSGTAEP